jgi:hypothetical protein
VSTRTFALIFGAAFTIIGLAGFLPGITLLAPHSHPDVTVDSFYGHVLGLFPVNILHNVVHLAFGIWGLLASRSLAASTGYGKGVAIIYAVLTIAGLIPGLNTMGGLVPLFGNDVWLHALLAAVAAYFGFVHRDRVDNVADRRV